MFNKLEFKAELVRQRKTTKEVAAYIGINQATLYRKINGQAEFTRTEIQKICDLLGEDVLMPIFFADGVA